MALKEKCYSIVKPAKVFKIAMRNKLPQQAVFYYIKNRKFIELFIFN